MIYDLLCLCLCAFFQDDSPCTACIVNSTAAHTKTHSHYDSVLVFLFMNIHKMFTLLHDISNFQSYETEIQNIIFRKKKQNDHGLNEFKNVSVLNKYVDFQNNS